MQGASQPGSAVQARRERRLLQLVMLTLLLVTVTVSPLGFHDLRLLFLLVTPFAVVLLAAVLIAPLARGRETERAERHAAAAVAGQRHAEAERHAMQTVQPGTLPVEDMPALVEAVARATADHGIHFACAHLRDEDMLQAFHAGEIRPADFRHGDHLRYTLLMLRRVPASLAGETIAHHLRMYLRHVCGSDALFHATRTHAWIAVLRAWAEQHPQATFAELLTRHAADLHGGALARYYSDELLNSERARRQRVRPDREQLPSTAASPAAYAPRMSRTYPAAAPPSSGPTIGTQA